jgi:hypothetical protein
MVAGGILAADLACTPVPSEAGSAATRLVEKLADWANRVADDPSKVRDRKSAVGLIKSSLQAERKTYPLEVAGVN